MDESLLTPTLAALLGIVAPLVVSLIKNWKMPRVITQLIVVLVSLFFGVLAFLVSDMWVGGVTWTVEALIGYAAFIATVATFVYNAYFRSTFLNERLEGFGAPQPPLGQLGRPGPSP